MHVTARKLYPDARICVSVLRPYDRWRVEHGKTPAMPANSTHPDYDANLPAWLRARDVLAGEDSVKSAGEKYLPRLNDQSEDEYHNYRARASFFNATARTTEGYVGLLFRRPPFLKLPDPSSALGQALATFAHDADLLGTSLTSYAKAIVSEVLAVGRAGSLVDWEGESERRVYVSRYVAENILNWRMERVNGRHLLTLVVLAEKTESGKQKAEMDEFETEMVDQLRVLKLVPVVSGEAPETTRGARVPPRKYVVEIWQRGESKVKRGKPDWKLVDVRVPLRLGKPLPLIPFVFHGPRHSLPEVDKLPLGDVIPVNLDHYRLDADYKHGMHFTALPTAWVSGFEKEAVLRIGSSTAWTTSTVGATAGFLEYKGQGLRTFERAQDRDERLMAVLGARLLESQKKVGETAESIELRQSGENSILGHMAMSLSASLTEILAWAYWWNSTVPMPEAVSHDEVVLELNTDYSMKGMSAPELVAVVSAWQRGALSRDSMLDLFRRGEILPEGRTNEEEAALIGAASRNHNGHLSPTLSPGGGAGEGKM